MKDLKYSLFNQNMRISVETSENKTQEKTQKGENNSQAFRMLCYRGIFQISITQLVD